MRLTQRNAILIAVGCATAAAILIYFYLLGLKPKQRVSDAPKQVEVVVPLANIPPYTVITRDMVTTDKLASTEVPKAAVTRLEDVVDYVAMDHLPARQPIVRTKVLPRGVALGLTGTIPPGMRAVAVALDPVMGVAGLLKPGDHVDVLATFEVADTLLARTVLQDVELLALGKQMYTAPAEEEEAAPAAEGGAAKPAAGGAKKEAEPKAKSSSKKEAAEQPQATLAVTPADAQKLVLADQRGKLRLSLRPVGEHDIVPMASTSVSAIAGPEYVRLQAQAARGGQPTPAADKPGAAAQPAGAGQPGVPTYVQPPMPGKPAGPARAPRTVEVIRGGQREQVAP